MSTIMLNMQQLIPAPLQSASLVAPLVLGLLALPCEAQREDRTWYFGNTGAGLDFNRCEPVVLHNGPSGGVMFEGATAISDPVDGSFLFATDGRTVFGPDMDPMLNGDIGISNSLAQIVIVPWPGSPTKYFIIMPEMQAGISWMPNHPASSMMHYAVVDMALENGTGAVISRHQPLLSDPHCEFMTAVLHPNGIDYWLITHEFDNNVFNVFTINNNGIDPTPTSQAIGPIVTTPQPGTPNSSNLDAIGGMRASRQGDRLVFTTMFNGITCLFDFDPWTGVLSSPITLALEGGGYGASFSPDGSKLYLSNNGNTTGSIFDQGRLIQFDLALASNEIQGSQAVIYAYPGEGGFTSLKQGPDRKIYVSHVSSADGMVFDNSLGVINDPDQVGALCDYQHDGVDLFPSLGSWSLNNLPEFDNSCSGVGLEEHDRSRCSGSVLGFDPTLERISWPTDIQFDDVRIFQVNGTVSESAPIPPGRTEMQLDGIRQPSGVYFIMLQGPSCSVYRKVVLIR